MEINRSFNILYHHRFKTWRLLKTIETTLKAYCPFPSPLFMRRGSCKKNQMKQVKLRYSCTEVVQSLKQLMMILSTDFPRKLVTYLLGFRAPATYYLSLVLVFTLIRIPNSTSRQPPFYLGTEAISFLHTWCGPCQWPTKYEIVKSNSFALLSMILKPLFPSHFINSGVFFEFPVLSLLGILMAAMFLRSTLSQAVL